MSITHRILLSVNDIFDVQISAHICSAINFYFVVSSRETRFTAIFQPGPICVTKICKRLETQPHTGRHKLLITNQFAQNAKPRAKKRKKKKQ